MTKIETQLEDHFEQIRTGRERVSYAIAAASAAIALITFLFKG